MRTATSGVYSIHQKEQKVNIKNICPQMSSFHIVVILEFKLKTLK